MKTMIKIFLIGIFITQAAYAAKEQQARMLGANIDGAMKLYWETYEWPKGLQAFNVKKKIKNNKWERLNKDPIAPQIDNRDWQNLGLKKQQADELERIYQDYISDKKLQKTPTAEFLQTLTKYGGLATGDRINLKSDFNLALIMGYGFVDSTFKDSEDTTYGIFYVYDQNQESPEPVATFKPKKNISIRPTIQFQRKDNNLTLKWDIDENLNEQAAISGFKVMQAEESKSSFIYDTPINYMEVKNGKMFWSIFVTLENTNTDITYTLTPITIFQTALPSTSTKYEYMEYIAIPPPTVAIKENMEDGSVNISWTLQALSQFKNRLSEMYIEKASWDNGSLVSTKYPVSLNSTEFLDTSIMRDGESYFYTLVVIDRKGNQWKGQSDSIWYTSVSKK